MDEFLGSVDLNQNGGLLVSSSYLTYANWTGFIGYLPSDDVEKRTSTNSIKKQPLMLSTLKMNININSGVSDAKWVTDEQILVGTDFGEIILYKINNTNNNLENNKFENVLAKCEHDDLITCLETKYDSTIALSGSEDSKIKVWDLKEQLSILTYGVHEHGITSLKMHPNDTNKFLSCSQDGKALLWDTRKERPAYSISHGLNGFPSAAGWSKLDLNQIAFGSETGQLGIYDLRMIAQKKPFCEPVQIHDRLIRKVKFNDHTNMIATAAEDCKTKVFEVVNPSVVVEAGIKEIYSYEHEDFVTDLTWNFDEKNPQYITCSWDGMIKSHEIIEKKIKNGH